MAKIKAGDLVQVISGRSQDRGGDRGKQGKVLAVRGDRVLVEGLNLATRHTKVGQTQRGTKTGGIEHVEATIHISNVALVNPDTHAPARVGYERDKDGQKVRVFKASRYDAKAVKAAAKKSGGKKASAAKAADVEAEDVAEVEETEVEEAAAAKPAAKAKAAKAAEPEVEAADATEAADDADEAAAEAPAPKKATKAKAAKADADEKSEN
jgi:large subunit ribosomal protein L24